MTKARKCSGDLVAVRAGSGTDTANAGRLLARLRQAGASAVMGVMVGMAAPVSADVIDVEESAVDGLEEDTRRTRQRSLRQLRDQIMADVTEALTQAETPLNDVALAQLERQILLGYQVAPNSTAAHVAALLKRCGGLERCAVVCDWALSQYVALRHSLAMALPLLSPDVGVPEAIEVLTQDRVAQVRLSAEEAATRWQLYRTTRAHSSVS